MEVTNYHALFHNCEDLKSQLSAQLVDCTVNEKQHVTLQYFKTVSSINLTMAQAAQFNLKVPLNSM